MLTETGLATIERSENLLCLEAIHLDNIVSVSSSIAEGLNVHRNLMAIIEPILSLPDVYLTGEHPFEVLFRTLVQNSFNNHMDILRSDDQFAIPYMEVEDSFRSWLKFYIACRSYDSGSSLAFLEVSPETMECRLKSSSLFPSKDDIAAYYHRFVEIQNERSQIELPEWFHNSYDKEISKPMMLFEMMAKPFEHRSLATASRGLLGLAPMTSQEGDGIWILRGARVPFVLRSLGNGNYLVIGEAYIHGFMNGEIFTRDGVDQGTATILKLQ
jgi:hypothetical protein